MSQHHFFDHSHSDQPIRVIGPGVRLILRDAEWQVTKTENLGNLGKLIFAVGISGLIRDKEGVFISGFEDANDIKIIDPKETKLTPDVSSNFLATRLYLEGQLRHALPLTDQIAVANTAPIDQLPFQFLPAKMALRSSRARLLIADDVGLGKTLEAGIVASELIARGRGRRILVVTTKSMLTQFQREFWTRFSIPLTRLDSAGIQSVKSNIPGNHNPFHYIDRSIISMDTLKDTSTTHSYSKHLKEANWDLIIVDEAHNVAERGRGDHSISKRSYLAQLLAERSDALLLLTATPHDGSMRSVASLINMLDPLAIEDWDKFKAEDIGDFLIRRWRTSESVKRDLSGKIENRKTKRLNVMASWPEERAFAALAQLTLHTDQNKGKASHLFKIVLEKSLFSSPAACLESVEKKLKALALSSRESDTLDLTALRAFKETIAAIEDKDFSKYSLLINLLKELSWTGENPRDRLVIFTERIATLKWLALHLKKTLHLPDNAICELQGSGGESDRLIQQKIEEFGQINSPIRILITTEIASEGVNLHYLCHKLIHFDIPWSMLTFQQRNGRIDRYGQEHCPHIWYLLTLSKDPKTRGDQRYLEILQEKDERIQTLGDRSAFAGFDDLTGEDSEEFLAKAIAEGKDESQFRQELEGDGKRSSHLSVEEVLSFTNHLPDHTSSPEIAGGRKISLFNSPFDFFVSSLRHLQGMGNPLKFRFSDQSNRMIELELPSELRDRRDFGIGHKRSIDTRWMPKEAVPQDELLRLTDDKDLLEAEIKDEQCLNESRWPKLQYLWEIHPLVHWMSDLATGFFQRDQAPVMTLAGVLGHDEVIFLLNGLLLNNKGYPILDEWLCARYQKGDFVSLTPLSQIFESLRLNRERPNAAKTRVDDLKPLLDDSIDRTSRHFKTLQRDLEIEIASKRQLEEERLNKLLKRRRAHFEVQIDQFKNLQSGLKSIHEQRLEKNFKKFQQDVESAKKQLDQINSFDRAVLPYVRLIAAFRGGI